MAIQQDQRADGAQVAQVEEIARQVAAAAIGAGGGIVGGGAAHEDGILVQAFGYRGRRDVLQLFGSLDLNRGWRVGAANAGAGNGDRFRLRIGDDLRVGGARKCEKAYRAGQNRLDGCAAHVRPLDIFLLASGTGGPEKSPMTILRQSVLNFSPMVT